MVVVGMPAPTLQAAILASRAGDPAVEKRAYLQLDDGVEVDDAAGQLVAVAGRPYDEGATYTVALPRNLLHGRWRGPRASLSTPPHEPSWPGGARLHMRLLMPSHAFSRRLMRAPQRARKR